MFIKTIYSIKINNYTTSVISKIILLNHAMECDGNGRITQYKSVVNFKVNIPQQIAK